MALSVAAGSNVDHQYDDSKMVSESLLKQWGFYPIQFGKPERIADVYLEGPVVLTLCTRTGVVIGHLKKNMRSNCDDSTYTLWKANGNRIILPTKMQRGIPYTYNIGRNHCSSDRLDEISPEHVSVGFGGNALILEDLGSDLGTMFRVQPLTSEFIDNYCKIPTGEDGSIEGMVNGRRVSIYTSRQIGKLSKNYFSVNEDSAGYNPYTGIIVLSDGLGGSLYGELASSMVVSQIKDHPSCDLSEGVKAASSEFRRMNTHIDNPLEMSNAVFSAVQIRGDYLNIANAGDSVVRIIRGGKVIYKTPRRNEEYQKVLDGKITEKDYYELGYNEGDAISVLLSTAHVGYDSVEGFKLEKGDIVLGVTDGMDIRSDKQLEKMIGYMTDSSSIVDFLVEDTKSVNINGSYCREYIENGNIETVYGIKAPGDNGSIFAYVH